MTETEKINTALSKAGINIDSIYELVNGSQRYPEAIPVLIKMLNEGISNDKLKEGVLRALTVKEAIGKAGKVLIKEFYNTPKEKRILRWVIGNTMETVITVDDLEDVIEIVTNKDNGISRQMFVLALGKIKSENVESILIQLLNDGEVASHALEALGKLKAKKAKNEITHLLADSNPLIRKEAQKALKKIG